MSMFNKANSEKVDEVVTSPARNNLGDINPECTPLSGKKSENFYSIVAILLWIMKRSRPDLKTSIGILCTRVSKSDEDNWKKLRTVLAYINSTIDDIGIIGANIISTIFT